MTDAPAHPSPRETPLWFGPEARPLLGWLTAPGEDRARGGVILAPPIGREWRAARFAYRQLAAALTALGFVTLRFDYHGVGDSSDTIEVPDLDAVWTADVAEAYHLLRSCGLGSVSAVGMRLGATIVGVAAVEHRLDLTSMVLWDPCESGRAYLRQLQAFEALRRQEHPLGDDGSLETTEFVFSPERVRELRRLSLEKLPPGRMASRLLVITRDDRAVSDRLSDRLDDEGAQWRITTEQAALVDVEPLFAAMPATTMRGIATWLDDVTTDPDAFTAPAARASAIVQRDAAGFAVRETCVAIGARRLFGVLSEPEGPATGPLVVFMNVSNEDHTGPSRLWVDLSRRWAARGLRCVRFDLSGIGDSADGSGLDIERLYEGQWLDDVASVAPSLAPEAPGDAFYVGLCSGALLSVEAALTRGARGVCAIEPPDGVAYHRHVLHMRHSARGYLRRLGDILNWAGLHLGSVVSPSCLLAASLLPKRLVDGGLTEVAERGIDLRVLVEDKSVESGRLSWLRQHVVRRMTSRTPYEAEVVPGLDHSMFLAKGREEAVARLDRQVLSYVETNPAGA